MTEQKSVVSEPDRHRSPMAKSKIISKNDEVQKRTKKAITLENQLRKKKYSRPIDDKSVDDISDLMTSIKVGEKWKTVGTKSVKFSPLFGTDQQRDGDMETLHVTNLQCVTGLLYYKTKSLEELRLEDHMNGYRYRGLPSGKSLFSRAKPKDTDLNYYWTETGTCGISFEPVKGEDEDQEAEMTAERLTLHQCITAMEGYEDKSLEELRIEDYLAGMFEIKISETEFNRQPSKNWHEGLFLTNPHGTLEHEYNPRTSMGNDYYSSDDKMNETVYYGGRISYHSITKMKEYANQCFEELRLVDYLGQRKGPTGSMYKASEEELVQLKIKYDMKVCIFIKRGSSEVREAGIVKFIGRLPGEVFGKGKGKLYVGIELKNSVGDGDGRYKHIRLFRTKPNCAKIVSLIAVLPEQLFDEFHTDESDIEDDEIEQESTNSHTGIHVEQRRCVICLSNSVEIFLYPCGHACLCAFCSNSITTCPVCRLHISEKKRVFFP